MYHKAENCCWYRFWIVDESFVELLCRHHDQYWYWCDPVILSFPYCYDWTKPPPRSEVKYLKIDLESKGFFPVWLGLCWLLFLRCFFLYFVPSYKSRSQGGCLTYRDIINIAITLSIMEISEIWVHIWALLIILYIKEYAGSDKG